MKIEPKVKLGKNGIARIEFPKQKPILVPKEDIPTVVEMLKATAYKLNSLLDSIEDEDEEEENFGNLAMG